MCSRKGSLAFPGNILASQPLEIVARDFTLLEKTSDGIENFLIVTDILFCMITQAYITTDQNVRTLAHILTEKWFYMSGVPQCIHLDQGHNFYGELLCH